MADHLILMAVFAFFVSVVFAMLMRDETRQQVRLGALLFAAFIVAAVVFGWLMYPFPL